MDKKQEAQMELNKSKNDAMRKQNEIKRLEERKKATDVTLEYLNKHKADMNALIDQRIADHEANKSDSESKLKAATAELSTMSASLESLKKGE